MYHLASGDERNVDLHNYDYDCFECYRPTNRLPTGTLNSKHIEIKEEEKWTQIKIEIESKLK